VAIGPEVFAALRQEWRSQLSVLSCETLAHVPRAAARRTQAADRAVTTREAADAEELRQQTLPRDDRQAGTSRRTHATASRRGDPYGLHKGEDR
jgi:hypothetical protein